MKVLIVFVALVCTAVGVNAQCDLPEGFSNFVTVNEADLKVTFATDKTIYPAGETVEFYFIVENTGAGTFSINWGIDPQDAIFVMQLPCTSLTQVCYDGAPFVHPAILYFYSSGTTLDPGECRIWTNSWETNLQPAAPGTYNVLGGMFEPTFDSAIGIFHVPTTGILLSITIEGTVPVEDGTWGQIKALYQ